MSRRRTRSRNQPTATPQTLRTNPYPKNPLKAFQHNDGLDAMQIAAGQAAAWRNARALAKDAIVLLLTGRFPRAIALSSLALEEVGKPAILAKLTPNDAGPVWREYRHHLLKTEYLTRMSHWIRQPLPRDAFWPQVNDGLKQLCLYTDCLRDSPTAPPRWSEPERLGSWWQLGQLAAGSVVAALFYAYDVPGMARREAEQYGQTRMPLPRWARRAWAALAGLDVEVVREDVDFAATNAPNAAPSSRK
jgi:AbiV family abortive infection protein